MQGARHEFYFNLGVIIGSLVFNFQESRIFLIIQ
jgi:hypothetical protein